MDLYSGNCPKFPWYGKTKFTESVYSGVQDWVDVYKSDFHRPNKENYASESKTVFHFISLFIINKYNKVWQEDCKKEKSKKTHVTRKLNYNCNFNVLWMDLNKKLLDIYRFYILYKIFNENNWNSISFYFFTLSQVTYDYFI